MPDREQQLLEQLVGDASVLQVDEAVGAEEDCCRYCGCTKHDGCVMTQRRGLHTVAYTCSWFVQPNHHGLGVCSNPKCVKKYLADRGAP